MLNVFNVYIVFSGSRRNDREQLIAGEFIAGKISRQVEIDRQTVS